MADAVEAASKSVVWVRGERNISGTVIGDGQVLTVAHVLHGDEVMVVTPDGRELSAAVAGRDPLSDLALLRVDGLNLPALMAGAGGRVGELLLAVGRPRRGDSGQGVQVSLGLMQRLGAERGLMPSGALPFRGVSGGALVNARGGLVGLLNAGVSRGELLAVPAARALKVASLLATSGRVPHGYLGIATQPVMFPAGEQANAEDGAAAPAGPQRESGGRRGRGGWGGRGLRQPGGKVGLTIVSIEDASPAATAGLLVGDVLLSLEDRPVRQPQELLWRVRDLAGRTVSARILRGGQEQDVTLVVGER